MTSNGVAVDVDYALDVRDVSFAYGGARALNGCSFGVRRAAVTGLIGPNGAGKSTLMEVIAGGLSPLSGSIHFAGRNIAGLGRLKVARLGIVRSFQISRYLPRLPVIENVMLAAPNQTGENPFLAVFARRAWRAQEAQLREKATDLLAHVGLEGMELAPASSLSGGQRRLLDIARALMAEPKVLLLDEPSAGVYPVLGRRIAERLRELPAQGITVLLVAHDMDFMAAACDEVVAMAQGLALTRGSLDEVRTNPEVLVSYLGG